MRSNGGWLGSNGGWLGSNVKQGAIAKQWLCLIVQSFEGWLQSSGAIAKQGCAARRGDREASGNCKARGDRKAMGNREARGNRKAMLDSEAARIIRSSDRSKDGCVCSTKGAIAKHWLRSFVRLRSKGRSRNNGCVCSSDRSKDGCEARGGKQGLFVRLIVRLLEATIVCLAKRQRQAKKLLVYPPLNDLTMWTKTHFGYYLFYN